VLLCVARVLCCAVVCLCSSFRRRSCICWCLCLRCGNRLSVIIIDN